MHGGLRHSWGLNLESPRLVRNPNDFGAFEEDLE